MPKSLLKAAGHDRKEINDLANLTFIGGKTNRNISNKQPSEYLPDIISKRGKAIFNDNYIPEEPELWNISNFEQFLSFRRNKIVEEINSFISSLA